MENLRGIDLNLLVVFDALLAERSVTRAGARVGLSQPAVSNALARLRNLLEDPLLVRVGSGMQPTPRALELAGPLHHALDALNRALSSAPTFDATKSSHVFRLSMAEDLELTLLPRLVERLSATAPGIDVSFIRASRETEDDLRTGRSDLYLGAWFKIPSALHHHLLRHEAFACIARDGHPAIRSRLTLKRFTELGHVLIGPADWPGDVIDTALSDQGFGRRVVCRVANAAVAPLVVARSDLIAVLPRTLAATFAEVLPLKVYVPPLDTSGFAVHMVWHPRAHALAPHRWLRQTIMDLVSADGW